MTTINESRKTNSLKKFLGIDKTISTIGIISPENAMGKQFSNIENNKRVERMKHMLKNMLTPYKRVKGMYNQLEHSFMLFNITVNDLKYIGHIFDQQSFIFGKFLEDKLEHPKIMFEYYEKTDKSDYVLSDKYEGYVKVDGSDYFTALTPNFKFTIPFSVLMNECYILDRKVNYRKKQSLEYINTYAFYFSRLLDESLTPKARIISRSHLYGNGWASFENRKQMLEDEEQFYLIDDLLLNDKI